MGAFVNGQLHFSCKVDGTEIPLGAGPLLKVFISQSCRQLLPATHLDLPDFANVFTKIVPINDGSTISVDLHDDVNRPHPGATFRAFGTPLRKPHSQFMHYSVTGILDAIPYLRGNPPNAITGSSVDVMQQIAKAMDFKYKGDISTDDHMTWRPGRFSWGTFAKHVTKHGWIGDKSLLTTAIDEQRQMHHVDVNSIFANSPVKANLVYGGTNALSQSVPTYACTHYRAINRSGMFNNWLGYGYRMTPSNLVSGVVEKFNTINAMKTTNLLDMSKAVLGQINGRARIDIPPMHTGNTHDNYLKARHQHMRATMMYSQNVYVMVPVSTALNLYDMVVFDVGNQDYVDQSTSGLYTITAMTRAVVNSRYYEKIELTNAGPQNSNQDLV